MSTICHVLLLTPRPAHPSHALWVCIIVLIYGAKATQSGRREVDSQSRCSVSWCRAHSTQRVVQPQISWESYAESCFITGTISFFLEPVGHLVVLWAWFVFHLNFKTSMSKSSPARVGGRALAAAKALCLPLAILFFTVLPSWVWHNSSMSNLDTCGTSYLRTIIIKHLPTSIFHGESCGTPGLLIPS